MTNIAATLRDEIEAIADEFGQHYHKVSRIALQAIYFQHWPPSPSHSVDALSNEIRQCDTPVMRPA
jgi:hypothetical protein